MAYCVHFASRIRVQDSDLPEQVKTARDAINCVGQVAIEVRDNVKELVGADGASLALKNSNRYASIVLRVAFSISDHPGLDLQVN